MICIYYGKPSHRLHTNLLVNDRTSTHLIIQRQCVRVEYIANIFFFIFLFKGDMSIHPEKGDLSTVDEEMLLVSSKRQKDNDDISHGQIL